LLSLVAQEFNTQGKMLEFCKKVLTNVSFDRILFRKELRKAIKWVSNEEIGQLKQWCQSRFGHIYGDIIAETFQPSLG